MLLRGGILKTVDCQEEKRTLRLTCANGIIEISDTDFLSVERKSVCEILVTGKTYTLIISGEDASIELARVLEEIRQCLDPGGNESSSASKKVDIYGYYAILGIDSGCSGEEIKKAYKKRCLEVHPDVNKSEGAHESFLRVQTAYEVLSDSSKRAKYDAECISTPTPDPQESINNRKSEETFEPIRCSVCNCITAQPRYVVFWETFSFLSTVRTPVQGVMCTKCAGKSAYNATKKSLIFGWWGIWGIIFTPMSVIGNISGGEKPAENNARLLLHQSWYFAQNDRLDLAYFLAKDAKTYLLRSSTKEKEKLLSACNTIIDHCKPLAQGKELDAVWERPLSQVVDQWKAVGICALTWTVALTAISGYVDEQNRQATEGAPKYTYQQPQTQSSEVSSLPPPPEDPAPALPPIPKTYLPLSTGYLPDKEVGDNTGYSGITLNNNTDSNFHVKLYKRKNGIWVPSREIYLKASEEFKIKDIDPGEYEIRRLDVQSKLASKSEPFTLEESRNPNGVRYSELTLTLHAINGNSRIIPINAKDF